MTRPSPPPWSPPVVEARILDAFQIKGELSEGDGGLGALAGVTWQRADGEEYYLNYTLDADRTEPGIDGTAFLANTENNLTVGGRRRFDRHESRKGEPAPCASRRRLRVGVNSHPCELCIQAAPLRRS